MKQKCAACNQTFEIPYGKRQVVTVKYEEPKGLVVDLFIDSSKPLCNECITDLFDEAL